jgi:hypothetical protein
VSIPASYPMARHSIDILLKNVADLCIHITKVMRLEAFYFSSLPINMTKYEEMQRDL